MTTNTPTALNRQELREAVDAAIQKTIQEDDRGGESLYHKIRNAVIAAYEAHRPVGEDAVEGAARAIVQDICNAISKPFDMEYVDTSTAKRTAKAVLQAIGYAELVEENKTLLKNLEDALREIRILQLNRDY